FRCAVVTRTAESSFFDRPRLLHCLFFVLLVRRPPSPTVVPYTTLFRSAVVFAGAVVVIALLGLLVVGIPFLSVMGIAAAGTVTVDRKSTRLNSSHVKISYAVFCLKKKQHTESWFMY